MKKTTKKRTTKSNVKASAIDAITGTDLKNAILVISLLTNLFLVCIWIALQLTSRYDEALIQFFIQR